MRVSQVKGNGNYKLHVTDKELRTITIALANLSLVDFEDDVKEQGLSEKEVAFGHMELFGQLCEILNMYPNESEVVE